MDNIEYAITEEEDSPEALPSLLKKIKSHEVAGFDGLEHNMHRKSRFHPSNAPHGPHPSVRTGDQEAKNFRHQRKHSVSISMPNSPIEVGLASEEDKRSIFFDFERDQQEVPESSFSESNSSNKQASKFHSQPMPKVSLLLTPDNFGNITSHANAGKLRDKRFDSFKTWSGKLERQITNLRGGRHQESGEEDDRVAHNKEISEALSVDRYFAALEGPELENLRPSEEIVLPDDRPWPFLLRYPISSFGICLGVSSQAIMWKTLATAESTKFLHISLLINIILWYISVCLTVVASIVYLLKIVLYFEAVRREYYHPIRVNFFFAPFTALLFLALGVPPSIATTLPPCLWYVLMFPILCLELKIYGQWMSGGQRRLSKVANPSNHLSVVGNFVGALLGGTMGLKEGPLFFYAIGLAHYAVLFVTLYQRLPTNETLPKELHPVFFLFVAAPSVASMAWAKISGSFDYGSRICYFIALFLYISLAVRVNFFRGFKFSLAWWAYTFPMTGAAIATIKYSNEVQNIVTQALSIILFVIATLTVLALFVTTIIHAFVLKDLFPNDICIAISERKPKQNSWFNHIRNGSSENIEHYLKFAKTDDRDVEANCMPSSS